MIEDPARSVSPGCRTASDAAERNPRLVSGNAARRRRFHRLGQIRTDIELREMIHYDKWQWKLVYQLGRFGQSYPHLKPSILQLRQAIAREQDGLIAVLNVLARWVALLTR